MSRFVLMSALTVAFFSVAIAQEVEEVDRVALSTGERYVRMVGLPLPDGAEVVSTAIGEAVVVAVVPPEAICNVIVDAPAVSLKVFLGGLETSVKEVPDIPELKEDFAFAGWAIYKLPGSYFPPGNWLWNVLLYGNSCTKAVDLSSYFVGSTSTEFNMLDPVAKARILRTSIVQFDGQGRPYSVNVPFGNPLAAADALWKVRHSWAGREKDLGYRTIQDGVVVPKE